MADHLLSDIDTDQPRECLGKTDAEREVCLSHLVMDDLYKNGGSLNSSLAPVDDSMLAEQAAPTQKPEMDAQGQLFIPAIRGYEHSQGLRVTIGSGAQPFSSTENRVMNTAPTVSSGGSVNFNYPF